MLKDVETPFKKSIVLVCSTCSKQFPGDLSHSSDRIKSELKIKAKEQFGKEVRVVNSSCLGICPENSVAITCVDLADKNFSTIQVDPSLDSSMIYNKLFFS